MFHSNPRETHPLRYYIYVSDTKLDMLFQQMPRKIRREISAEIRIDLKLASVVLRNADDPGLSRIAKLKLIEQYIDKHEDVGSLGEPGRRFFRGKMGMQYVLMREYEFTGDSMILRESPAGVLFRGSDDEGSSCVVLGGSSYHLLGEERATPSRSSSTLPRIIHMLMDPPHQTHLSSKWAEMAIATDRYVEHQPVQRLEFLASVLAEERAYEDKDGKLIHVTLGSPLYVALA